LNVGAGLIKAGICCALIGLIAGCATQKQESGAAARKSGGERQLNNQWAGKPLKELVAVYGEPSSVMEYPNSQNTSVIVYRDNQKLPASCAHAFTIQHGAVPTVVNYFCR
jgi:hypothetical protein